MTDSANLSADDIIKKLNMTPHPEGGYFKEVYRSFDVVYSEKASSERSALTDIYFLLKEGEISRFHKVLHDEIWNFYFGAPLRLIDHFNSELNEIILGKENLNFKYTIKANHWQAAESTGEFTLVGCTVAPGFDFNDFSFMEDEDNISSLKINFPHYKKYL